MEEIAYTVRRSERARRVRVTVDPVRGVQVVLPRPAPEREAAAAVAELRPWIERRVDDLIRARAIVADRGDTVPYLNEVLRVCTEPGRTRAARRGAVLIVPDGVGRGPALERYYRRAARAEIAGRLDRACAEVGSSYARLTIRGQHTRWASCSTAGAMSFNWRLLLAPEPVLDYVVWHEVCHLEVMDHSPRFWGLLGERCQDWREHARWLTRHGATLVL
ncbi:MAG: M48 family metallopeptidase [Solirubrobacteraceae bacterium]